MSDDAPKARPARKIGRRQPLTAKAADAQDAMFSRASDDDGTHAVPAESVMTVLLVMLVPATPVVATLAAGVGRNTV